MCGSALLLVETAATAHTIYEWARACSLGFTTSKLRCQAYDMEPRPSTCTRRRSLIFASPRTIPRAAPKTLVLGYRYDPVISDGAVKSPMFPTIHIRLPLDRGGTRNRADNMTGASRRTHHRCSHTPVQQERWIPTRGVSSRRTVALGGSLRSSSSASRRLKDRCWLF